MITLSNGHSFEFMAASGALAYDGRGWPWECPLRWMKLIQPELFTIVTKSLTLKTRKGNLRWWNPLRCVRLIRGGAVNAVGLTNPGIDWWIRDVYPKIAASKLNIIVSIVGESLQDYMELAIRLKDCEAIKAIEINASCPNSPGELQANAQTVIDTAQALKYVTKLPLILKLSCTHDYVHIAQALEKTVAPPPVPGQDARSAGWTGGGVEAISINSVPWSVAFPDKKSPLAKFGGGAVSGKAAQIYTWKMVENLAANTNIPVIGASVWDYEDIEKIFGLGAKAVAFGSIFLKYPWRPTEFVNRWRENQKN
ncbi:MAG: hypothetical protein Q7T03_10690 [Deltaproteobacteria bacterium]|nr:hypothetical protein [Deltaproteobacteria bacterium]